jgi:cell division protein FtsX
MRAQNIDTKKMTLISIIASIEDNSMIDKLLNFISPSDTQAEKKIKFPSMTKQQIIDQAILAEKEIEQGKTISHEKAYQEFKKWK